MRICDPGPYRRGSRARYAIAPGQSEPPPAPAPQAAQPTPGQTPLYDPQQLPTQRGQVQQFTLTPRGDIDGLILTDGTEVKTPPHLSTEIAYSIKPGDTVTIHGLHAAALPLVQAVSITDEATGRTVVDNGPPGPGRGPGAGPAAPVPGLTEVQGRVRMALHGPRGDVNGALLEDGTVLRLPPPEAERFAAILQPGQTLVAEGIELRQPDRQGARGPADRRVARSVEPGSGARPDRAARRAGAAHRRSERSDGNACALKQASLDWLNFFLADVKDGLGPFLAIYLLSSQHWDPGKIGVVMMIAGVATVAARTPFGALIDWTRWKRGLMVTAAVAVAVGALAMSLFPNFWLIAGAQAAIGSADAIFPAAIGAISLGIVGPEHVHPTGSAETKPSTMPAMPSPRSWRAWPVG